MDAAYSFLLPVAPVVVNAELMAVNALRVLFYHWVCDTFWLCLTG